MRVLCQLLTIALAISAPGCELEPSAVISAHPDALPPTPVSTFDPAGRGTITGRVTWDGPIPTPLPFVYGVPKSDGSFDRQLVPNPNRPDIEPISRGLVGAVVFLRGVDPSAAKPWDLSPVRVEMNDRQVRVRQGDSAPGRVGFVRRGAPVEMASAEPVYHVLRGRGAAFFSLTFPDPGGPISRTFDEVGRVELSSGAGYYWASADLLVDDHPYYTLTDRKGRYTLQQVPAGAVDLVVWLPGWTVARHERDPETGLITRQSYGPPVEVVSRVAVERGKSVARDVIVSEPRSHGK
ncbi:MAG: hypothetical protein JWO38_1041 [Gemmataceae bacterium]|nr:hypothetical protein [Gemmataceae bacterium]